ncbi:MAG: hypothetical protein QXH44_08535 [Pyrobaculum sp.]
MALVVEKLESGYGKLKIPKAKRTPWSKGQDSQRGRTTDVSHRQSFNV